GDYSLFQILIKVPYDYLGDPLVAHINSVDPSAYFRNAILRIIQMCGRSVRGVNDWAATSSPARLWKKDMTSKGIIVFSRFLSRCHMITLVTH
ncbi:hypothetical protein CQA65_30215, partial [Klebsiella pneumoniae]